MKQLILLVLLLPIPAWAQTVTDLSDPGSNGVLFRNALGTTRISASADVIALFSGSCSVATFLRGDGSCGASLPLLDFSTGAAPTNPASGFIRLYGNSTSGLLACLTSSGGSCLPTVDITAAGAVCDDVADDTAVINSVLTTLFNAGGGTLTVPTGKTCRVNGQITLPNTGGTHPTQNPIRITSIGNSDMKAAAGASTAPTGGGSLDLRFNATTAKILTFGSGYLEVDHLLLQDKASDCAAFLFSTSTVVHVHDMGFFGTTAGASACNDAIILGGTSTTIDGTVTSPFQGYGTVVEAVHFHQIQRAVFGQTYANGIQIVNNTIWADSGASALAAIEFAPTAGQSDTGNYIAGNLIEISFYKYGVWFNGGAVGNTMVGNSLFDWTATNTAGYRFETGAQYNFVQDGWDSNLTAEFSDADGTNSYITALQSVTSVLRQPWKFTNAGTPMQISKAGGNSNAYDILNSTTNDEIYQQVPSTGQPWQLELKSAGGATENVFQFLRAAANSEYKIGKAADTTVFIEPGVGTSDLKLRSLGNGQVVWLCGGNSVCNTWVDTNGQIHNNTSTGTAPLAITSTTPVANLTTVPTTYNAAGTQQTATHLVQDTCTLGTNCGVTLSGSAAYTNATSYTCTCEDDTAIAACRVNQTAGNGFTITGTGTDIIRYICGGN